MKKVMNKPVDYVDEMLDGLCAAHPRHFSQPQKRVIVRTGGAVPGKVGIVTGGGSGHLPIFTGYIGPGLLDAAAIGDVFASPSAEQMASAMRHANGGAGVLRLYGNYGGDVMNFDMAAEMAGMEDIEVRTVVTTDDVASAPIAPARVQLMSTTTGATRFGRMCRTRIPARPSPIASAATTKPETRNLIVSARTTRAVPGHANAPMEPPTTQASTSATTTETTTMTASSTGMERKTSPIRESTASSQPPNIPAAEPTATPMTAAPTVAMRPTATDGPVPCTTRANVSHPCLVNPRG